MRADRKYIKYITTWLVVAACLVWAAAGISLVRAATATNAGGDLGGLASAICPIVYPVDEMPGGHGYQYAFYGNGFFISREGYLITAAHVLHSFASGGQPYILVARNEAPPTMLKADVIAVDQEHDVAVLRATPNPFAGNYRVGILALGTQTPVRGDGVIVAALRPSRRGPRTFDTELQDHSAARVVDYQSSQLDKGMGDTELLLFNHEVILGQSGAPVLSADGHAVVGFIEGQWLRPAAGLASQMEQGTTSVGAAVPIRYAIAVLREKGIAWGGVSEKEGVAAGGGTRAGKS
jgi:S1-C subfamily serine protease